VTEPTQEPTQGSTQTPNVSEYASKKIAAGICGILIGWLGIHKFILGMNTPGIIMILVTVLSCFMLSPVMSIIGLIEGIIYLTKTDEEFYQTYAIEKKEWF
jgi:TM2 domain-containing membrane protein YozV